MVRPAAQKITGISRSESFSPLLKTRPASRTERLMLHAMPASGASQLGLLQVGILAPKRLAKRAIDRNTFKRLAREACRAHLTGFFGQVLIRLNRPIQAIGLQDRLQWKAELHQLLSNPSFRKQFEGLSAPTKSE